MNSVPSVGAPYEATIIPPILRQPRERVGRSSDKIMAPETDQQVERIAENDVIVVFILVVTHSI